MQAGVHRQLKNGIKPFSEIITSKAVSRPGMFSVHQAEDRYYFEIPYSMMGRVMLAVTRFVRTPTSAGYGGEWLNRQMIRFERGNEKKVFVRATALVNTGSDTSAPI